jgi:hypothetical protein
LGSQQYSTIIENEEPIEMDLMLPPRKQVMPNISLRHNEKRKSQQLNPIKKINPTLSGLSQVNLITPLRSSSLARDESRLSVLAANRVPRKDYMVPYSVHNSQPHIDISTKSDQKLTIRDKNHRYGPTHRDIINSRLYSDKAHRLQKLYIGSLQLLPSSKLKRPHQLQPLESSVGHVRRSEYSIPEINTGPQPSRKNLDISNIERTLTLGNTPSAMMGKNRLSK